MLQLKFKVFDIIMMELAVMIKDLLKFDALQKDVDMHHHKVEKAQEVEKIMTPLLTQ